MVNAFTNKIHGSELSEPTAKIAIIISRFNESITKKLLTGAKSALAECGVSNDNVTVFWVPGAFEIPLAAQTAARSEKFDAIIALGAVIRGETPHFDYVAGATESGVLKVGLETGLPVIFGVLTTDTVKQAEDRAGGKYGNKGEEAAIAAIEMIGLLKKIE